MSSKRSLGIPEAPFRQTPCSACHDPYAEIRNPKKASAVSRGRRHLAHVAKIKGLKCRPSVQTAKVKFIDNIHFSLWHLSDEHQTVGIQMRPRARASPPKPGGAATEGPNQPSRRDSFGRCLHRRDHRGDTGDSVAGGNAQLRLRAGGPKHGLHRGASIQSQGHIETEDQAEQKGEQKGDRVCRSGSGARGSKRKRSGRWLGRRVGGDSVQRGL